MTELVNVICMRVEDQEKSYAPARPVPCVLCGKDTWLSKSSENLCEERGFKPNIICTRCLDKVKPVVPVEILPPSEEQLQEIISVLTPDKERN